MSEHAPEPDPKEIIGGTFSAASSSYDEVIAFFAPFGRALAAAADLQPGERVLDVACGRGASLFPALDAVGETGSLLGVDLSHGMIHRLSADLALRGVTNAEAVVGDAESLDLRDASFDAILAGFLIFFASDPRQVLAELLRVVRPGGRVALSIFDGPPAFAWLADVVKELVGDQPARPSDEFNKASVLEPALVDAGFGTPVGTDLTVRFVFASVDEVERWQRSHGGRILLDHLDDLQLARYRGLITERLQDHRVDDGFELVQRARMVVAHRPD